MFDVVVVAAVVVATCGVVGGAWLGRCQGRHPGLDTVADTLVAVGWRKLKLEIYTKR